MNATLVRIIRERMQSQTTEQLLELWVINDRATWSPETFEAARSILAERGQMDLPPQNEPAPIAGKHSPAADPAVQLRFRWVRPLLWIGIALALLDLGQQAVAAWVLWDDMRLSRYGGGDAWGMLHGISRHLLLPVLFIAAAVAGLMHRPWARNVLLGWAVAAVGIGVIAAVLGVWGSLWRFDGFDWALLRAFSTLGAEARSMVLPAVLFILLRRPEMLAAFEPPVPGFEPLTGPNASRPASPAETPPGPASPAGAFSPEVRG